VLKELMMEKVLEYDLDVTKINSTVAVELGKAFIRTSFKVALMGFILLQTALTIKQYHQSLIVPFRVETQESLMSKRTTEALVLLNCPNEKIKTIRESIIQGAPIAGVDPVLLAVLMESESEFKLTARSPMGYKSLMQTPTSTGYVATDTMHGCDKLREKLALAKGDYVKALTWYKGSPALYLKNGKKSDGHKQALAVLTKYKQINERIALNGQRESEGRH
jgi:hypothetical protein